MALISLVKPIVATISHTMAKHAPQIMTGLAVVGVGECIFTAAKAAPKAKAVMEHYHDVMDRMDASGSATEEDRRELKKSTAKKIAWIWVPTVLAGLSTSTLMIGSTVILVKRLSKEAIKVAKLSSALAYSESVSKDILQKVSEKYSKEDAAAIATEVAKKTADEKAAEHGIQKAKIRDDAPDDVKREIREHLTGTGWLLYLDEYSGTYFRSCRRAVEEGIHQFKSKLFGRDVMNVREWLGCFGIFEYVPDWTDVMGWNTNYTDPRTFEPDISDAYFDERFGEYVHTIHLGCSDRPYSLMNYRFT